MFTDGSVTGYSRLPSQRLFAANSLVLKRARLRWDLYTVKALKWNPPVMVSGFTSSAKLWINDVSHTLCLTEKTKAKTLGECGIRENPLH